MSERYTLISADCHAGANHETYRGYLEEKYLDEFDAWRNRYSNPFSSLTSDTRDRNWNSERRMTEQEADGCVAEVVFPNTIPPFFPTGAVIARAPGPDEYEVRLAGIRAHNRWLADWCAEYPVRRAGIGQIFLNDIDDAIADVRWCHGHGLRGGILLQPVPDDLKHLDPLYSRSYDPLWAVCEELGIVVNTHSGGAGMPDYGRHKAAGQVWIAEATFFARRPLSHLLIAGDLRAIPGAATRHHRERVFLDPRDPGRVGQLLRPDPDHRSDRGAQVRSGGHPGQTAERVLLRELLGRDELSLPG